MYDVPFSFIWSGHLMTGSVMGAAILALSSAASWLLSISMPLDRTVWAFAIALLAAETLGALFASWNQRHSEIPQPGGILPTLLVPFLYCTFYPGLTAVFVGADAALVVLGVAAILSVADILIFRPWEPGLSREELDERGEEVRAMTREHFGLDGSPDEVPT